MPTWQQLNPRMKDELNPQDEGNPILLRTERYVRCILCGTYFPEHAPDLVQQVDNHHKQQHP